MAPISAALFSTVETTITYRSLITSVSLVTREINCPTGCVSKALSGWRSAASITSVRSRCTTPTAAWLNSSAWK
ncbi:Uncharacterised protein [Serratia marcescens]|uniref:Uncharacterized protein n=1 Tax=Serratia marcescens TaxID=615 RepID=A0A380AMZ2_SERMA|nr:Uncharacterised protein [Serratia marcescens]